MALAFPWVEKSRKDMGSTREGASQRIVFLWHASETLLAGATPEPFLFEAHHTQERCTRAGEENKGLRRGECEHQEQETSGTNRLHLVSCRSERIRASTHRAIIEFALIQYRYLTQSCFRAHISHRTLRKGDLVKGVIIAKALHKRHLCFSWSYLKQHRRKTSPPPLHEHSHIHTHICLLVHAYPPLLTGTIDTGPANAASHPTLLILPTIHCPLPCSSLCRQPVESRKIQSLCQLPYWSSSPRPQENLPELLVTQFINLFLVVYRHRVSHTSAQYTFALLFWATDSQGYLKLVSVIQLSRR